MVGRRVVSGSADAEKKTNVRTFAERNTSDNTDAVVDSGSRTRTRRTTSSQQKSHSETRRTASSASRSTQSTPDDVNEVMYGVSQRQSDPGEFVDPLTLDSEDIIAKTLDETSGTLGVAMRPKVVDFNARLKERRRANVCSIALRITAAIAVLAVLAGVIWLLFFSPLFRLDESQITVSGSNEWVSEDDIREIAAQQAGKSLLLVSGNDVVDQLNDIPGVTEAEVTKQFPNSLLVTVEAEKPAAMLQTPDGTLTAVDQEGQALNSVDGASVDGIPIIEVDSVDDGQSDRAVLEALQVLAGLSDDMRARISSVSAETQDSVTTELDDGEYTVVWGDSSDLELKIAVVEEILGDDDVIGDNQEINVSAPLRPIIK